MTTKTTRYLDAQGRIILPPHIRRHLNLTSGHIVEIALDDDGTIRIRATEERCSICGESVAGKHFTPLTVGSETKRICYNCAQEIARAMMK